MNKLTMKIVGFDILTSSLHIKFASDLAEKDIEEYPYHAFNVVEMNEQVTQEEVLSALAVNGWYIALQQDVAEDIARNSTKITEYQGLIGTEFGFTGEDLFALQAAENQPQVEGLMVI